MGEFVALSARGPLGNGRGDRDAGCVAGGVGLELGGGKDDR